MKTQAAQLDSREARRQRRPFHPSVALLLTLCCAAPAAAAEFERVPVLEKNVAFWRKVYAVWGENEIALHDRDDLGVVYRIVPVPGRGEKVKGVTRSQAIEKARAEVVAALAALAQKKPTTAEGLSGVEREVFENLKGVTRPDKYTRPSDIRAQNGLRERAREGWAALGQYEEGIRAEINKAGMPADIIALAFVESLFNIRAISHAGAAGMWQFMPATGREYMQVNDVVDERIDPILATAAAMKYLASARRLLGPWPLAITSYNYGRTGMKRAANAVGSDDFGVIYERYTSNKNFGFAAKNYYASFLALLDVVQQPERYFPGLKKKPAWRFDVIRLPFSVFATQLDQVAGLSVEELGRYNPSLTKKARLGKVPLPRGLPLRVPIGYGSKVTASLQGMSFQERRRALQHIHQWHRANGRQTLANIASRYGVAEADVAVLAGLPLGATPSKGTRVPIPGGQARYSLIPEARDLSVPEAPPVPEALLALAPASPPVQAAPAPAAAKQPRRAQVRLRQLEVTNLEEAFPAVDVLTTARADDLGDVDILSRAAGEESLDEELPSNDDSRRVAPSKGEQQSEFPSTS